MALVATDPVVLRLSPLAMQVCVPDAWSEADVLRLAETHAPCGTTAGWQIRCIGSPLLVEAQERATCLERGGYLHLMLDA